MRSLLVRFVLGTAASFAVLAFAAVPKPEASPPVSPLDERVLEQTTLVPAAESVTAYTVPREGRVVLTRYCGDACVRCEGATVGGGAFQPRGSRCVVYRPGIELPPGETVRCTNRCQTTGAALFSGVLHP